MDSAIVETLMPLDEAMTAGTETAVAQVSLLLQALFSSATETIAVTEDVVEESAVAEPVVSEDVTVMSVDVAVEFVAVIRTSESFSSEDWVA